MPNEPLVTITREEDGNVIARGGDELAHTLLRRAGFVYEQTIRTYWHRLPWDIGERHENDLASNAARMLTAVGYHVALSPDLFTGAVTTPSDQQGRHVYGHQILALTDQLNGSETSEAAAKVTDHVLDPHDGVLVRLNEFFEAAAERAKESGTDEGWALSDDFTEAAAVLTALCEDLHVATDQLRDLDRTPRQSWRAQAMKHYTATPSQGRSNDVTPAASPSTTVPTAPKTRRSR